MYDYERKRYAIHGNHYVLASLLLDIHLNTYEKIIAMLSIWPTTSIMGFALRKLKCFRVMGLLPDTQNRRCACAGNAGNVFPVTAGKRSRHASRHVRHARAVMHAGIINEQFSLKSAAGEKRSRHSRRMCNLQFYVYGKRPISRKYHWSKCSCIIQDTFSFVATCHGNGTRCIILGDPQMEINPGKESFHCRAD